MSGSHGQGARVDGWVARTLLATGSIGLLGALLTDGLAVIGRHSGMAFHGSIELVQAFITLGSASAIAYASLGAAHATVDLLFDRFPKWAQELAHRVTAALNFLFVAALVAGSVWIAAEYWDAGERTELLGIEVRWMRLFWIVCAIIAAIAILLPAFARKSRPDDQPPAELTGEGL